jgi:hypothetical protein
MALIQPKLQNKLQNPPSNAKFASRPPSGKLDWPAPPDVGCGGFSESLTFCRSPVGRTNDSAVSEVFTWESLGRIERVDTPFKCTADSKSSVVADILEEECSALIPEVVKIRDKMEGRDRWPVLIVTSGNGTGAV